MLERALSTTKTIEIASVRVHPSKRRLDPDRVEELAESIKQVGLLQPIGVSGENNLVFGLHRLEACKLLGWTEIPAVLVTPQDSLVAELIGIDENLIRNELTALERAEYLARRKEIYEALHPKARKGQYGYKGTQIVKKAKNEAASFSVASAIKTGLSPRTIQHDVQIAQKIAPEVREIIRNTPLADSKRDLLELARMPIEEQREIVHQIVSSNETIDKAKMAVRRARAIKKEQAALAAVANNLRDLVTITDSQDVVYCKALVTDPPYGILDLSWEPVDLYSFTTTWLRKWNESGADFIVSFWSQKYLWEGRKWFDECLTNYQFKHLLVWHYPNNTAPQGRQSFKRTWDPIFFYRQKGSEAQVGVGGSEWGGDFHIFDCHVAAIPQSRYSGEDMKQHPTQKPVSVFRWLINALTQPGDLICDPFCGSGTSGIAALQLKRRYYGIEIDPGFRELAMRRIAAYGQK